MECGGVTGAVGLSSCQRMLYARLESDVDHTEDAQQRRLEAGANDATGRGVPAACVRALPEVAAGAPEMEGIGGQTEARAELVTGYAEHRASLQEKKNYRRAIKIDLKLPEASTALAGVPRRKDFAEGEEGRLAWKAQFNAYAGDFAYSHVGTETVRNRMGAVGMWGDYCKREGHGTFVEWQRQEKGTLKKILVPVRDASSGQMKVPDPECIAEYVMVMAIGDTKARPKGGTAEYRAAWHHGSQHAHFKLRAREHGRGAYADTPLRFVSIEKMKEALAQFFDKHLQVSAVPAEREL